VEGAEGASSPYGGGFVLASVYRRRRIHFAMWSSIHKRVSISSSMSVPPLWRAEASLLKHLSNVKIDGEM